MASEKNDLTLREMMEDSGVTGMILKAREPWRDMSKLYYDFLHSIQMNFSQAQVFDTVADFIQNCTDTLDIMRGTRNSETHISIRNLGTFFYA